MCNGLSKSKTKSNSNKVCNRFFGRLQVNFDIAVTNHKRTTTTLVRLIEIIDWA